MDFLIHIDTISIGLSFFLHFNGSKLDFSELRCISVLEGFVIILANSADPDEMQHFEGLAYAGSHKSKRSIFGLFSQLG